MERIKVGIEKDWLSVGDICEYMGVSAFVVTSQLRTGGLPGVLTFDHYWTLEPVDGGTRVTQHENYSGICAWFWDQGWFEDAYGSSIRALGNQVQASNPPTSE